MRRIAIIVVALLLVSPIVTIGRAKPVESPRPTPTSILTPRSYLPLVAINPPTPAPTPTARPTLAAQR